MDLLNASNTELFLELQRRGLLTNATYHAKMDLAKEGESIKAILTYGEQIKDCKCTQCNKTKPADQFKHYQARVDKNGRLLKTNSLCIECQNAHKNELKNAKDKLIESGQKLPEMPQPGSICANCEREWHHNWHLHHTEDKIIGYICSQCNMHMADHKNKKVLDKRGNKGYLMDFK